MKINKISEQMEFDIDGSNSSLPCEHSELLNEIGLYDEIYIYRGLELLGYECQIRELGEYLKNKDERYLSILLDLLRKKFVKG